MSKRIDLTGKKFGRLTALAYVGSRNGRRFYVFRCECGKEKELLGESVSRGLTRSCGCLMLEKVTTHGLSYHKTYKLWNGMLKRCTSKRIHCWKDYGGRGITVCDRWSTFPNFLADMGERPEGMTIERIDNAKGYSKENCRWATRADQMRNTRRTRLITFDGLTLCVADWARRIGIARVTLINRLKTWPLEAALTTPNMEARNAH